jgi:hypothetical protein
VLTVLSTSAAHRVSSYGNQRRRRRVPAGQAGPGFLQVGVRLPMGWPVTEPPKPPVPRWLPLAAATVVGVAGLAAVAAAVACRRQAVAAPALPEAPPAPDPPRSLESLLGVLSAEKPARRAQPPSRAASPLPPEDPKSRRTRVIVLSIAAAVVWLWVAVYLCDAMDGPAYEPWPAPHTDVGPAYRKDLNGIVVDRY